MGLLANMRTDLSKLRTFDIVLCVVFGVLARLWALFGSPLANVVLFAVGPLGWVTGALALMPMYWFILLPLALRRNGMLVLVTGLVNTSLRTATGDPFGIVAVQGEIVAGLMIWIAAAGLNYPKNIWVWFLYGLLFDIGDWGSFGVYLGVPPLEGSLALGWLSYVGLSGITAAIYCLAVPLIARRLGRLSTLGGPPPR